jgi:hypothetical protein
MEEDVSLEELLMNQLNTYEEKLPAKRSYGLFFGDDGDITLLSSESRTIKMPSSRVRSDPDSNDNDDDSDNDDFWM